MLVLLNVPVLQAHTGVKHPAFSVPLAHTGVRHHALHVQVLLLPILVLLIVPVQQARTGVEVHVTYALRVQQV